MKRKISIKSKIYVAGHTGLVGSMIIRRLKHFGYKNIITIRRKNLDLRNQNEVYKFIKIRNQMLLLMQQLLLEAYMQIINIEQNSFIITYQYKVI